MKNKLLKQLLIVACAGTSFVSCNDYLTEVNPNEIQKTEFYKTLTETEAGVTAMYSVLRTPEIWNIQKEAYRSDMAYPGYGRPVPVDDYSALWYNHGYDNSTIEVQGKWAAIYKTIFRANQVIEGLEKLEASGALDTEDKLQTRDEQMGQALFIRGTMHHYLALSYRYSNGKCAIIADRAAEKTSDFHKGLSTPEEVLAFARKDLKAAYELLPVKYDAATTQSKGLGRVTRASAATILGHSYLLQTNQDAADFEQSIDSAMVYYADVIENPEYGLSLVTDMSKINTYDGEFNSESIFEISYSRNHNAETQNMWDETSMVNRLGFYTYNMGLPSWIVIAYSQEAMDTLDQRNYYDSIPNAETPEVTFRRPRLVSLRCGATIAVVNDIHTPYYGSIATDKLVCQWNGYGVGFYRHYMEDELTDKDPGGEWYAGTNLVINKLSEVMINYAECLVYKGQVNEAIEIINQVRRRWGLMLIGPDDGLGMNLYDGITYDADDLLEHIMYTEKPLETSIEGYETRWVDLRRWGVIEKRFQKLSNKVYYHTGFTYRVNGTDYNRWNSLLLDKHPGTANYEDKLIMDYEYDKTAIHVVTEKEKNSFYYPIPLGEVQNNIHIEKN